MYYCLVCGYRGLIAPQYDSEGLPNFELCICCGYQAGYDDDDQGHSIESYRKWWFERGAPWCHLEDKPKDWDLKKQLKNINIII